MRIGAKGGGVGPTGADPTAAKRAPGGDHATSSSAVEGRGFADVLATGGTRASEQASAAPSATPAENRAVLDAARGVLHRVRAGEIAPDVARQTLVDAVVAHRGEALSPSARNGLRAALERLLAEDPYLSTQFSRATTTTERGRG